MRNNILSSASIGRFLREKRMEFNFTQDELAKKLGISKTAVSNWEHGNSIVDVKYLVSLSNIFSVCIDDILFPHPNGTEDAKYSDLTVQFQNVVSFRETNASDCKRILDLFVDCRITLIDLIRKYKENPSEELWQDIAQTNKFGFSLAFDRWEVLKKEHLDSCDFLKTSIENDLETIWAPLFFNDFDTEEPGSPQRQIPHLFVDVICVEPEDDKSYQCLVPKTAMLNFILFAGGTRIFRKYVSTFTQEHKNRLLEHILKPRPYQVPLKAKEKALKALLHEGAELWENGKNLTDHLMRKLL